MIDSATQRQVINALIADWRVGHYQLEVRYRVAKTIGDPKEQLDSIRKDMERCEKALDALQDELNAIAQEPTP